MPSMFRFSLFILTFMCLLYSPAAATELPAVEGLELLRRAFLDVKDFSADILQEKQLSLMKKKMTARGLVRFRKPDTFYMELFSPYAAKVLLKGNVITTMLASSGNAQKIILPPEQGLGSWFSSFDRPVKTLPDGFDIHAEKQGENVCIQIRPRVKGALKALEVKFQQPGRLKKLTIEENNRDVTIITFLKMRKNPGLTDKQFILE
jgi:outer membrane lipoprotein carrier protein